LTAEVPVARYYTSARRERHHGMLLPVVRRMLDELSSGTRVLDIGCGSGYVSGELIRMGFEVTGIDVSESGIRAAQSANPGSTFHVGSATDPSIAEVVGTGFDAVLGMEVIEHLYSPAGFLEICRSLLKPCGMLILTTPYHGYLKNLALALTGRWDEHLQPCHEGGHIKFWSRRTLHRALTTHGFQPVQFQGCGRVRWLWKSMAVKAMKMQDSA
jgi:2-polyprenyl-3-methyl-5-hydroxy-6-metoxy-1,4-benzoquinol methylase